jgi:quinolinate synthase
MSYDMLERLGRLKAERNAILLVHNYQRPELQEVADCLGDSLELSRRAAEAEADVIVFCGVRFMAETAAVLNPGRTVLMPDEHAGCPMADMITARQLANLRAGHPDAVVVCYVNSSAEVKALSDICCTSANAVQIVQSVPEDREIIFVPDQHLGDWARRQTGREMILWPGYCPTHRRIRPADIQRMREEHPGAVVIVHPECTHEVRRLADLVASTGGMVRAGREREEREFIVGTELGLIDRLRRENPHKRFWCATELADCPNMKLNTLEKLIWCLEDMRYRVTVPEQTAAKARTAIERMLALA